MTTSSSPFSVLRAQAEQIAAMIKAAELGESIDPRFAAKLEAARAKASFKLGIVMDDKVITIDMPWATIRATGEVGLSEFILKQMRDLRDAIH